MTLFGRLADEVADMCDCVKRASPGGENDIVKKCARLPEASLDFAERFLDSLIDASDKED